MKIENVSMCFSTRKGKITALKNLDFEVKKGEFLAIVGPSGCGKSTLINILVGILAPTNGKVILAGEEVKGRYGIPKVCRISLDDCPRKH